MMRLLLFVLALVMCWPAFGAGGTRIVVPSHDIPRGAVLTYSDLAMTTVSTEMPAGTATSTGDLVGMEARRMLHSGESVRLQDVRRPILVARGATVTMSFEAPGILLTAVGRAMTEGGLGETVTVQNPASFRQISAVVVGPGQVRALGAAQSPRLAAAQP